MFKPPADCRDIPRDAVNEWSVNASKQSLLPHLAYGQGHGVVDRGQELSDWYCHECGGKIKGNKIKCSKCNVFDLRRMDRNISTGHGEPQIVTFSIVYKEQDCVQCYIYWNGQMHRFIPTEMEQTRTVLMDIFKMDDGRYDHNKDFLDSIGGQWFIGQLAERIQDPDFMYFRKISH